MQEEHDTIIVIRGAHSRQGLIEVAVDCICGERLARREIRMLSLQARSEALALAIDDPVSWEIHLNAVQRRQEVLGDLAGVRSA